MYGSELDLAKEKSAQDLEGEREAAAIMLKVIVVRHGERQTLMAWQNPVCPRIPLLHIQKRAVEATAFHRLHLLSFGVIPLHQPDVESSPRFHGKLPSTHNSATEELVSDILILHLCFRLLTHPASPTVV